MTEKKGFNLTRKQKYIIATSFAVIITCIYVASVFLLFNSFARNYKDDIIKESATHLIDINEQVALIVEEDNDMVWKATDSLLHSILAYDVLDADKMFAFMDEEKDIWDIDDVYIITANGNCETSSGIIINNDTASKMAVEAVENGRYMSISNSSMTCTLPAPEDTTLTYNGSKIVALATVRNLTSLIDNMNFSSFDDKAYLYLTENLGGKISQLTHKDAVDVANVYSLFDVENLKCIVHENSHALAIERSYEGACVFLDSSTDVSRYIVITPVDIGEATPLKLFYVVPEDVVNSNMSNFSDRTTNLSLYLIGALFLLAFVVFFVFYFLRGKKYMQDIASRERLFDLLVANTKNAFGLLHINDDTPIYISENTNQILGDEYFTLHKIDGVYRIFSNEPDKESGTINRINDELRDWDGDSDFSSDYIPYTYNGNHCYFVFKLFPDADGEDYIVIVQDVTKEREREDALRNTLVLADSANIAKTRFLSNMSHDIRTPMNAIVNMTNFALDSMDDKKKLDEYLNVIRDSSEHLLHLINDILDMSKIESGKMVIEAESFDLEDTLSDTEEMIKSISSQKKQTLNITHDIKTSKLIGDRLKITQVLINLLNNAVKYTPEGGEISFTVTELHSLKSELGVFRFVVKDNGIGIDKEKLGKIFEPFVRSDEQVEKIEGTGLGLSICKNYVEAMGGFLSVTSRVGLGSTFVVELHFNKDFRNIEVTEKPINNKPASFVGKRVLLVEDNQINRTVATMILSKLGFEVETANDGQEGYKTFVNSKPGYYDLIYMDVQMPIMNGYEATASIRDSTHPQAKSVPIIAMTANVFSEDIEKSRVSGMDGHVGKPIILDELITITKKVLDEKNVK